MGVGVGVGVYHIHPSITDDSLYLIIKLVLILYNEKESITVT